MEISGWDETTRTVTIKGSTAQLEDLAKELSTWEPKGGWSSAARLLFNEMRGE